MLKRGLLLIRRLFLTVTKYEMEGSGDNKTFIFCQKQHVSCIFIYFNYNFQTPQYLSDDDNANVQLPDLITQTTAIKII